MAVAHLAFDFRLRHECRDRVDDDAVDAVGANQHVGNFQTLLAGVRLRDQEIGDLDAKALGILRVERVFSVDVCRNAAILLDFGDDLKTERGLAR